MFVSKDYTNPNNFICVRNFNQTQLFDEITLEQVKKLLPLFLNSKSIIVSEELKKYLL